MDFMFQTRPSGHPLQSIAPVQKNAIEELMHIRPQYPGRVRPARRSFVVTRCRQCPADPRKQFLAVERLSEKALITLHGRNQLLAQLTARDQYYRQLGTRTMCQSL